MASAGSEGVLCLVSVSGFLGRLVRSLEEETGHLCMGGVEVETGTACPSMGAAGF